MFNRNIHGERIITAGRIIPKETNKNYYEPQFDATKIKLKRLINEYLCDKEKSRCVRTRKCECLDVCVYGQVYIKKSGEIQCTEPMSKEE